MAGVGMQRSGMISALAREQYAAVAQMRWRMLVNSLRTKRGGFELGARVVAGTFFAVVGLGAGFGLGFAAWSIATEGQWRFLPFVLWPVLVLWQMVPVMMASFQEHVDLGDLLRFPVSFGSYLLLYLLFGLFDVAGILGGICLAGIWVGLTAARPHLLLPVGLVLFVFAVFNILLTRMIFAWIDRWLAQRRTREILSGVFLFLLLLVQVLNPAFHMHDRHTTHILFQFLRIAEQVQNALPPGVAARGIHAAALGRLNTSAEYLGWLTLYALAPGALLCLRLRAEYRGESLGEGPAHVTRTKAAERIQRRRLFEASGPVGAVFEKELRYLSRSGVMLYSLVAPLVILFLFGNGGRNVQGVGNFNQYALPLGAAYGFLGLTRLIYNSLGGEGTGIQLYFISPTPFRTVMLAKNLVQITLFGAELALVCGIVYFRFGVPRPEMLAVTFSWLLFALPVQLAAGNVLSITMAYRMTLTRLSREQGATGSGLLSLLIQASLVGIGALVVVVLASRGHLWWAVPIFLVLSVVGITAWLRVLANADRMAAARRETLISVLARA